MSLIRPEIQAEAIRSREILAGLGLFGLGAYAALASGGILMVLGAVATLAGIGICLIGVQRRRFRRVGDGPGVVQVTEAQIAYFGPLNGGIVALDQLQRLMLDPQSHPLHWVLYSSQGEVLHIPVTAKGAEALFDVFTQLPGLDTQAMLRALDAPGDLPRVIWRSPDLRLG